VSDKIYEDMIFCMSLFGASHQPTHKIYRKCLPNNPLFSPTMHSVPKSLGRTIRMKRARLKPYATDIKKNSQAHELYKLVYRLPENLSSLLVQPEIAKRPASKKKKQKEGMVTANNQLGVILEWEGVVEDDDPDLEPRVWYVLSLEEAKSFPPDAVLKEIEGMRTDQAISEVLCWSEDPVEIQRLAARKELIYQTLRGGYYKLQPGILDFLNTLVDFDIPIAITTTHTRASLEEGIRAVGLWDYFDAIVALEDFCEGKPDGEMFEVAAEQLGLKPDICLVFGNSNLSIESAHNAGMRCVAVASRHPAYELQAANHVVRWLDQLSVVDLQRLADGEAIGRRGRESDMDMEIVIKE
jgi:5-amino-6-(5-phospho-D-ribitylamino)uracil phosphatase